ncbi:MAG: FRG domain-containing protein, partial [Methylocella sp.]
LERRGGGAYRVYEYYKLITVIKPAIETFTGSVWSTPDLKEVAEWTSSCDVFSLKLSFVNEELAYSYLAHLRHHRFPSPLLDWSCSPYVAAYFAFAHARLSKYVAIYVFIESPNNFKLRGSGRPAIYTASGQM